MTGDDFPPRPTPEAVHDALTSAGFYPDNEPASVLAIEVVFLQEALARVEALIEMEHNDSRILVSRIREALSDPGRVDSA